MVVGLSRPRLTIADAITKLGFVLIRMRGSKIIKARKAFQSKMRTVTLMNSRLEWQWFGNSTDSQGAMEMVYKTLYMQGQ